MIDGTDEKEATAFCNLWHFLFLVATDE